MRQPIGLVSLGLILLLVAPLAAQDPYGNASQGTGGFFPVLSCNQAFMGNGKFAFQIQNGLGGASGLLGLSTRPDRFMVGSSEILISLAFPNLLLVLPVTLGGQKGVPGVGSAIVPFPLAFPPMPSLAGLDFYAQFVVLDYPAPGSPAATRGLKVELTYPPLVFVGTSVGGSTDPYYFVDPQTLTLVRKGGSTFSDNVTGAAFAYGGTGLFVGSSIRNQVNFADTTSIPATWRNIYTSSGQGCYGVAYDKQNGHLYTLTDPGNNMRELVVLDVANPSSPSFGSMIGQTFNLTGGNQFTERWALSRDGKLAAVLVGFINVSTLTLVDTDPTSVTYLKIIASSQVPLTAGFTLTTRVEFTPDNDVILVTIQVAGSAPGEVARYDVNVGQWIDHNPTMAGIQNIGQNSTPPAALGSAPTDIEMAPDGTFAVISGMGSPGWAGRIDLAPGNVSFFSYQALTPGPSLQGAWACGLARDGGLMSVGTFPSSQLVLLDPMTGKLVGTVPLAGASNVYTVEHR